MSGSRATAEGTKRFEDRHKADSTCFYRKAQEFTVSGIGIGTYLGEMDEATDASYVEAIREAVALGVNIIDTSLNYRHQRSERNIAEALTGMPRDEVVLCTKAGYLVPGALPAGMMESDDIAGGMHSMAPSFLDHQLQQSLRNLRARTVDVFYLHNPETQIRFVAREVFHKRLRAAFEKLEELSESGRIGYYGTATWDGVRKPGQLSIVGLEAMAREIAGDKHRFRFVQLPFNLAMSEARSSAHEVLRGKPLSPLMAAAELGITVVASAPLLQSRLATGLPHALASRFPGATTDAQRAVQFTRSTPGITSALIGMSKSSHVRENLAVRAVAPLDPPDYDALWHATS